MSYPYILIKACNDHICNFCDNFINKNENCFKNNEEEYYHIDCLSKKAFLEENKEEK